MPNHILIERLCAARVVPVIRNPLCLSRRDRDRMAAGGGMRVFEITMTIPGATALIRTWAGDPDLLIGAGTVPDAATAPTLPGCRSPLHCRAVDRSNPGGAVPQAGAVLMLGAVHAHRGRAALVAGADAREGVSRRGRLAGPAHIRALASVLPDCDVLPDGRGGAGQSRRLSGRRRCVRRYGRGAGGCEADCRR